MATETLVRAGTMGIPGAPCPKPRNPPRAGPGALVGLRVCGDERQRQEQRLQTQIPKHFPLPNLPSYRYRLGTLKSRSGPKTNIGMENSSKGWCGWVSGASRSRSLKASGPIEAFPAGRAPCHTIHTHRNKTQKNHGVSTPLLPLTNPTRPKNWDLEDPPQRRRTLSGHGRDDLTLRGRALPLKCHFFG